jgi:hypothetical protein
MPKTNIFQTLKETPQLFFCIIVCSFSLNSCSYIKRLKTTPSGVNKNLIQISDKQYIENLRNSLLQADTSLFSLRSLMKVKYKNLESTKDSTVDEEHTPPRQQTFRQVFLFKKPHLLRLETIPLNTAYALSVLVTNSKTSLYIDNVEKKAYTGNIEHVLFNSLLRLPASEEELISFLSGRVPVKYLKKNDLTFYQESEKTQLDDRLQSPSIQKIHIFYRNILEWVIDAKTLALLHVTAKDQFKDKVLLEADFEWEELKNLNAPSETKISHVTMPSKYVFTIPSEKTQIEGKYEQYEINENAKIVDEEKFIVKIPDGFEVVNYN